MPSSRGFLELLSRSLPIKRIAEIARLSQNVVVLIAAPMLLLAERRFD
jgi:hypothetical protein